LSAYADDRGNRVVFTGSPSKSMKFTFRGENNVAYIHPEAQAKKLLVDFNSDNGVFVLGANPRPRGFTAEVRVGQDSTVRIGDGVSATAMVIISAVEGTRVDIGDDVMFASQNQVRADDGHPIFDIHTGKRINEAHSVCIGNHTWVGFGSIVLSGVQIGEGSVIGARSLVTRDIPNNVVAVGSPAQVIRKDIAWERPHLGLTPPYYKPDASTVDTSKYWRPTDSDAEPCPAPEALPDWTQQELERMAAMPAGSQAPATAEHARSSRGTARRGAGRLWRGGRALARRVARRGSRG